MNESKLPHAIISAVVSALSASWAWLFAHGSPILMALSACSFLYSIRATRLTIRVKRLEETFRQNELTNQENESRGRRRADGDMSI